MTRIATLKPRLGTVTNRLRITEADRDKARDATQEYRRWYRIARWASKPHGLRWRTLLRDQFTCQICKRLEHNTSLLVADHKIPHKGDPNLFWAEANLWTLCKACHDGAKQREEHRRGERYGRP